MSFSNAVDTLVNVMNQATHEEKLRFFSLVKNLETTLSAAPKDSFSATESVQALVKLEDIAEHLRAKLPLGGNLPSEQFFYPQTGENADCNSATTLHLDAFLYGDDVTTELFNDRKLPCYYCASCGSRDIKDLSIVSHSASKERLIYIYKVLLPPLDGKIVVDIGSRLGAMLYGAYLLSRAKHIAGIEMNHDFVTLQQDAIAYGQLQDRISVFEGDVRNFSHVVQQADLVLLNNVFEFFMPAALQIQMWQFIRQSLKPGALLVTVPALQTSLQNLQTGIDLQTWVRELRPFNPAAAMVDVDETETSEIKLYQVL